MGQDDKTSRVTASPKTVAVYTLMTTAIFELLDEKGIVSAEQVAERMKRINIDLISDTVLHHNMLMIEAIFQLLTENGILKGEQVKARIQKLMAETSRKSQWLQ